MDFDQIPGPLVAVWGIGLTVVAIAALLALRAFVKPRNPRSGWRYDRTYNVKTFKQGKK